MCLGDDFLLYLFILLILPTMLCARKVGVIGGGNWGTAMARHLARSNDTEVLLWVKDESVGEDGESLCNIINEAHENSKYLPGVALPHSLRASANIEEVCKACEVLFVGVPHQYVENTLKAMAPYVAKNTIVVSLVKGMAIKKDGPELISEMISNILHLDTEVAVLMGANVASDVARDEFVEASIGCKDNDIADIIKSLVHTSTFQIDYITDDVASTELMGAIKNVIAIGAGLCDGLSVGTSTKAAIIRRGMSEMVQFRDLFCGNQPAMSRSVLTASCGVADVVATCFGGRNRKCAEEWCRKRLLSPTTTTSPAAAALLWEQVETELLNGQKLQGLGTCHELLACLRSYGENLGITKGRATWQENEDGFEHILARFPLFERIYDIVVNGACPSSLVEW